MFFDGVSSELDSLNQLGQFKLHREFNLADNERFRGMGSIQRCMERCLILIP